MIKISKYKSLMYNVVYARNFKFVEQNLIIVERLLLYLVVCL